MISRPVGVLPQPDYPCSVLAVNLAAEDSTSVAEILRGSYWTLKEARTCQEALKIVRRGQERVVLCDLRMPDGNWNTLVEKLREIPEPPAVIVVSRRAEERLWSEVLRAGGYDVLITPLERTELFQVLFIAWVAGRREEERLLEALKKPPATERHVCASPRSASREG